MSEHLAGKVGHLENRVSTLEREMGLLKHYGARIVLLAILVLIGVALNIKASTMTSLILESLKRS